MSKARARLLYFIDRGRDRPDWHKAPYHRYLICTEYGRARWEAGWTGDGATVWSREAGEHPGGGWLLERWKGFDIDYGHLVRSCEMPDGTHAGFYHPGKDLPPWTLLHLAAWWSDREIPAWLVKAGVRFPADDFSQRSIAKGVPESGRRKVRHVFPGEEVLALADWLEERGHGEAARDVRLTLGGHGAGRGDLFEE